MSLFEGELSLDEIKSMNIPELSNIVQAKLRMIEKRNKAEEAARKLEKGLGKMMKGKM